MNKKKSVLAIVLKVLAVIFFASFLFSIYYAYDYISGYQGVTFATQWRAIIATYIGQCAVPCISFILCYVLSEVVKKLEGIELALVGNAVEKEVSETVVEEVVANEEALDEVSDEDFIAELKKEEVEKTAE